MKEKIGKYRQLVRAALGQVRVKNRGRAWCPRRFLVIIFLVVVVAPQRAAHVETPEAWVLNAKILALNPDVYSLWGHRREMLLASWPSRSWEEKRALLAGELELTAEALRGKNPKSYVTWHHRQWMLALAFHEDQAREAGAPTATSEEPRVDDASVAADSTPTSPSSSSSSSSWVPLCDWSRELELLNRFLDADERNFHAWKHRLWVATLAGRTPDEELAFTHARLVRNFSNYSAWHYRSQALAAAGRLRPAALGEELIFVRNALFTESDDQSCWMYHRWLLECLADLSHGKHPPRPSALQRRVKTTPTPSASGADAEPADATIEASLSSSSSSSSASTSTASSSSTLLASFGRLHTPSSDSTSLPVHWEPPAGPIASRWTLVEAIGRDEEVEEGEEEGEGKDDASNGAGEIGSSARSKRAAATVTAEEQAAAVALLEAELGAIESLSSAEGGRNRWCLLTLVHLHDLVEAAGVRRDRAEREERLATLAELDGRHRRFYAHLGASSMAKGSPAAAAAGGEVGEGGGSP